MGNSSSSPSPRIYEPPRVRPPEPRFAMNNERTSKYKVISDNYGSVEEVQKALVNAGLESSNLIVGIDFTKSNQWTGQRSFAGRSLHAISPHEPNPYEQALSIIGRTLSPFDEDNLIPCFGFGDSTTHDKQVFSFYPDHRPCHGFEEALARYREIVPHVRLSGPTSFAPIINAAVDIVESSGGQYHVLVIVADGQIDGPQERATVDALVNASNYPLSIVLVGVGDGPWNMMQAFDDNLPARTFDNFQFINFTQIMASNLPPQRKEAQFALAALMEIPMQYQATAELHLLSKQRGTSPGVLPLRPPPMIPSQAPSYMPSAPAPPNTTAYYYPPSSPAAAAPPPAAPVPDMAVLECPVCLTDRKDMAFNCGHQTCRTCADSLTHCPICRAVITSRIRLY